MDLADPARVVMTPAAAATLRALALAPDAHFTMRQLARVAGINHTTARAVVNRLVEHGLVVTEPAGRAVLCSFNQAHLAADAVSALVTLRTRLLRALADEIGTWPTAPLHASVYGSGARGDGSTRSDLDLLVVRPDLLDIEAEDEWEDQLAASSGRLRLMTGNPVSYLDTTRAGLHEAVIAGEPILGSWRRDAVHPLGRRLDTLLRAKR
jgi:predicted nucleotidyltransferase